METLSGRRQSRNGEHQKIGLDFQNRSGWNMAARSHSKHSFWECRFLHNHLETVAAEMSERLPNLPTLAYYTGLWHDLGKYHQDWQQSLEAAVEKRTDREEFMSYSSFQKVNSKMARTFSGEPRSSILVIKFPKKEPNISLNGSTQVTSTL